MGNDWTPGYASSSTSPSLTRPSSPEIAQNTSNEGTHLGTGSALSTRLDEDFPNGQILTTPGRFYKQTLMVEVDMHDARSRSRAMKIAVGLPGVISATIVPDENQLKVVGDGVDPVNLTALFRKDMSSKIGRLLGMCMGCV